MSNEEQAVYVKKPFMLALKGDVTLHFIDGQILQGTFTTQDELHVFLTIDDAPVMVPRQQIRFIKGEVIEDEFQEESVRDIRTRSDTAPAIPYHPEVMEDTLPPQQDEDDSTKNDRPESTMEYQTVSEPVSNSYDSTVILDTSSMQDAGDEYESTVILDTNAKPSTGGYDPYATEIENNIPSDDYDSTVILERDVQHPSSQTDDSGGYTGPVATGGYTGPADSTMILGDDDTPIPFPQGAGSTIMSDNPYASHGKNSPQLVCTSGPHNGQTFTLTDSLTIGRGSTNAVALVNDKESSRRHATITRQGDDYIIQDQNSLNGTFVNNQPAIGPYHLRDGDVILIGVTYLNYKAG